MATINMNFLSKALGRQTNISVILPSYAFADAMVRKEDGGYYQEGMKFQTLWLLHGFSGDQEDYIKFTNIVRYAEANKLAVIMPAAYNEGYTDYEDGAKYMSFVTDELMEVCQSFFPLSTKREDNFIGGLSMGANGTMKIALAYPEKYSYAFCMSGACTKLGGPTRTIDWFGDDPKVFNGGVHGSEKEFVNTINDGYYMAQKNIEENKELPKFMISVGDQDFILKACQDANEHLSKLGYDVVYEEIPGYGHEWDFWDMTLRKVIETWLPLKKAPIYK